MGTLLAPLHNLQWEHLSAYVLQHYFWNIVNLADLVGHKPRQLGKRPDGPDLVLNWQGIDELQETVIEERHPRRDRVGHGGGVDAIEQSRQVEVLEQQQHSVEERLGIQRVVQATDVTLQRLSQRLAVDAGYPGAQSLSELLGGSEGSSSWVASGPLL